ncbi:hypothetical protein GCM10023091_32990 [Ravibacter arvi]|uniref:Leucine-binding protein domain-containing protein n=1 Tax=Ravibacter arvi TaxID=2051041 RepID=A0ABP8M5H1_9BACT
MNRLTGILFFLALAYTASAQTTRKKGGDAEYSAAIQAFKAGRYGEAMNKFAPLARDYTNQERSVFAHYYYANAAQRLDKDKESFGMLQQLMNRYPGWGRRDEVYYLAGLVNFKMKNYYRALDYLGKISVSSFQNDVAGLKQKFLANVTDMPTLKGLFKQFPDDRVVASYLVKAIRERKSATAQDREMAENLVQQFKLSEEQPRTKEKAGSKTDWVRKAREEKKYYDVAVLLPFRVSAFDASSRNRNNQYVFDYYTGLLMAQKALLKEKIDVRLTPFDIGNVRNSVSGLASDEAFGHADLVLGPLYPETSEEAAEFSRKSGVPVINPLSTDSKLLAEKSSHYYLAHASLDLQSRQVADVAKSIDPNVTAVIYWGDSSKDSTLAALYAKEVQAVGGKVLALKKIGGSGETINPSIANDGALKPSHVAFFSTDPRSGRALLNAMRSAGYETTPVIATATSFDRYNTDFDIYGRDLYLLDTDFVDYGRPEVKRFQYDYFLANGTLPSVYAFQGYDQLLFFGRKLDKFKDKITEGISQSSASDAEGYLIAGFDYRKTRENAIFSVRKHQGNNSWVPVAIHR